MRKNSYRENEIIEQTRQVIQSFYGRKTELTIAPMSEDFMWIGSNDFQWCEGIDEFIRVTKKEYQEEPVLLSDEEYHLLFHDRNVWVVYGRYKVTATLKDLSRIRLHIRVTFIWRMIKSLFVSIRNFISESCWTPLYLLYKNRQFSGSGPFIRL